jgi:hypothetical protein
MSANATEYTDLIAGAHVCKPRFTEWLFELTEPLRKARERLAALRSDFDVDTAVGKQLDAVGARIGVSRDLPLTLTGVYFALDDVGGIGLDRGVWKGAYDPVYGMTTLGDDTYRAVIKAKILANHWDGTNGSLPGFLSEALSYFGVPAKVLDLQDLQTMHVALHLTKDTTPPIVWELFSRRIIDVTAAGVSIAIVNNDPWFGFDYDTASVKGLDSGSWFTFSQLSQPKEIADGN